MTNKEAIERLTELLKCTNLLSNTDHESMRVGIKALEVVEEIKEAHKRFYDFPVSRAVCIQEILCNAYGTKEDSESWLREYKHDL